MGHVQIDLEKQSRFYSQTYTLGDPVGVKALLRDCHLLGSRRFKGDTAASDILIDLHSAIESAGLTERQAEAIAWVYERDLSQAQTARMMRIRPDSVQDLIAAATGRIAAIFRQWQYGAVVVQLAGEDPL